MFSKVVQIALFCLMLVVMAVPSFAVMSAADITATTTGISDSLTLFYTIGGSILVVCAAIWGFRKVKSLL